MYFELEQAISEAQSGSSVPVSPEDAYKAAVASSNQAQSGSSVPVSVRDIVKLCL